ncbi:hypothetical protein V8G54_031260 [Vigna mungo]|uniref:Carbohydrate kinase PfkB domain-containing protein n=1 Tax=Vigna mungo TaxID=3915 RepID=A0AAQ3MYA9_VIGMU
MWNLCTVIPNASSTFTFSVQPHPFLNFVNRRRRPRCRVTMSSDPQNAVVVGCGGVSVDFLASVAAYPKPDDKIRTTNLKVQGGGNAGNALTCLARLGLNARLISKVADDSQGRGILDELRADGVDTSFIVVLFKTALFVIFTVLDMSNIMIPCGCIPCYLQVSKEGTSPFTYIIVDNQTKTRTCIHTPGYPPMIPDNLPKSSLLSALDGAKIAYFDGRLPDTALLVAQEAVKKNIPILIDAERPREGLDDLLKLADYVVCSAKFPKLSNLYAILFVMEKGHFFPDSNGTYHFPFLVAAWTEASTLPQALVSMLLMLPNIKFVIVTLGKDGCIMLERTADTGPSAEEVDADTLLESLELKRNRSVSTPTCMQSSVAKLKAEGIGTVSGKLYVGTAESIPPSELVDTTGAGDAFIGAVIYAICAKFTPEKMLSFAANVAGAKCRDLGARSGLPYRADPRLESFILENLSTSNEMSSLGYSTELFSGANDHGHLNFLPSIYLTFRSGNEDIISFLVFTSLELTSSWITMKSKDSVFWCCEAKLKVAKEAEEVAVEGVEVEVIEGGADEGLGGEAVPSPSTYVKLADEENEVDQ